MGQVYRARDTKLNRDVALKVLPDSFANDPERLARFTREARTLASLNHQNIAHIHGLEESGGVRALVMELVEGEDLSQRIGRGALPVDDALPIAMQIDDALELIGHDGRRWRPPPPPMTGRVQKSIFPENCTRRAPCWCRSACRSSCCSRPCRRKVDRVEQVEDVGAERHAVAARDSEPLRDREVRHELRRAVEGQDLHRAHLAGAGVEEHLAVEARARSACRPRPLCRSVSMTFGIDEVHRAVDARARRTGS